MSSGLRTKLFQESFAHHNKNVGGFFDKGYIKIERKLWDQVYSNELISALNANGMSASLIAGTKPKMTDDDWVAMTSFIYAELIKDNSKRKSYKWITTKGLRRNKKEMFCPYVRNSVLNKKLTPSKVDINRGAQNSFRKFTINYFSSGSFKASSGRALRKLGARPGQGVSSMFNFGKSYGICLGVSAGLKLPTTTVTPVVWQRALKVEKGKDGNRLRAVQTFPNFSNLFARKKDDGRADAALIAYWGAVFFSDNVEN